MELQKNVTGVPYCYGNVLSYGANVRPAVAQFAMEEEPQLPEYVVNGRRKYRIASIVLTAAALAAAVASIVLGVFVFMDSFNDSNSSSTSPDFFFDATLFALGTLCFVDGGISFIAMVTCLSYLAAKPHELLIAAPRKYGAFVCLCISMVVLVLFACACLGLTIATMAVPGTVSVGCQIGLCVVLGTRVVALVAFFAILVKNRRLA